MRSLLLFLCISVFTSVNGEGIFKKLASLFGGESIGKVVGEVPMDLDGGTPRTANGKGVETLQNTELEQLISQSAELIRAGTATESIPSLLTVLEQDPDNTEANLLLGTIFLELGRPDQAESFLYKAVKGTDYGSVVPVVNLMSAIKQNGDLKLAMEVGQAALDAGKIDAPGKKTIGEVLGNINIALMNYTQASDWFFFAAMISPAETSTSLWLQASTLVFPPDVRDAIVAKSVLLEAYKFKPLDPQVVFYFGLATDVGGDVEKGIKLYQSAIDLDREQQGSSTTIPDAWALLGTALYSLGSFQEADDCFTRAYSLNPDNALMLLNWARTSIELKQPEKCKQAASEALRVNPGDAQGQAVLASCGA